MIVSKLNLKLGKLCYSVFAGSWVFAVELIFLTNDICLIGGDKIPKDFILLFWKREVVVESVNNSFFGSLPEGRVINFNILDFNLPSFCIE